jgi:hypothetical protein
MGVLNISPIPDLYMMKVTTLVEKLKGLKPKQAFANILYLLRYDLKQSFVDTQAQLIQEQDYKLTLLKQELLYYKIKDYFANHPSDTFTEELQYLTKLGHVCVFPYVQTKTLADVAYGYDALKQLPYVVHDNTKKIYFPRGWEPEQAKQTYLNYIQVENLLGGDYTAKSPHKYQSDTIFVKEGDVVIDVGAAEALFALNVVDKAEKVIIIESEPVWIEPLRATFEPYMNKVELIHKRVSDRDSGQEITLMSCLKSINPNRLFIKMDIEGYETTLIENNQDLFSADIDINVVCCTYHKPDDAATLKAYFDGWGYDTEFSDGCMLFYWDELMAPPFFRKGVLRASKQRQHT